MWRIISRTQRRRGFGPPGLLHGTSLVSRIACEFLRPHGHFEAQSELTGLTARGTSIHHDAESSLYDQATTSDTRDVDTTVAGRVLGRRDFSAP